jgi:hypothetical protein
MMILSASAGVLRGLSWISVALAAIAVVSGLLALRTRVRERRHRTGPFVTAVTPPNQGAAHVSEEVRQRHGEPRDTTSGEQTRRWHDSLQEADRAEGERAARYEELARKRRHDTDASSGPSPEKGDSQEAAPIMGSPPMSGQPPGTDTNKEH